MSERDAESVGGLEEEPVFIRLVPVFARAVKLFDLSEIQLRVELVFAHV